MDFVVVYINAASLISTDFADLCKQRFLDHNIFVLGKKKPNISLVKVPMQDLAVVDQKHEDSTQKVHSPVLQNGP